MARKKFTVTPPKDTKKEPVRVSADSEKDARALARQSLGGMGRLPNHTQVVREAAGPDAPAGPGTGDPA